MKVVVVAKITQDAGSVTLISEHTTLEAALNDVSNQARSQKTQAKLRSIGVTTPRKWGDKWPDAAHAYFMANHHVSPRSLLIAALNQYFPRADTPYTKGSVRHYGHKHGVYTRKRTRASKQGDKV